MNHAIIPRCSKHHRYKYKGAVKLAKYFMAYKGKWPIPPSKSGYHLSVPLIWKKTYPHSKSPSIHINPMVKPPCFPPLLAHLWATRHHASFHRRRTDPCPSPQTRGAGGDKRFHLKKWIGLKETKYRTTPYFMGKSMVLMGKSLVLMGKSMVSWENLWFPVKNFPSTNSVIHEQTWTQSDDGEISTWTSHQLDFPINKII